MFLMRRAKVEDVPTLLKLAKMVHFINLPADKDIIGDKISWSRQCFLKATRGDPAVGKAGTSKGKPGKSAATNSPSKSAASTGQSGLASAVTRSDLFMFALEDTESGGVLGTSQIISKMGGPGHPNVSFALHRKEKFSTSLQVGATHTVAKLVLDESGPTEIGGLILQPSYRGHKAKLGRFLSLVRFHFVGLHPRLFSDRIIAEMMGPLTPDGHNTLWEYLGRRFINLTYPEADNFCQYSKEFIISLLPHEEIYLTLLPPEARSVIAEVGPETIPARRLLEKLGFAYKNQIDVFDGGPMLECATKDISIVKRTRLATLGDAAEVSECRELAMISHVDDDGEFRCVNVPAKIGRDGTVSLAQEHMSLLQAEPGAEIGVTPMGEPAPGGGMAAGENGVAAQSSASSVAKRPKSSRRSAAPRR
jgi:arginine N-succinyltransferase